VNTQKYIIKQSIPTCEWVTRLKVVMFDDYTQEILLIYPSAHPHTRDGMSIGCISETERKKERIGKHVVLIDLLVERIERSLFSIFIFIRNQSDKLTYLLLFYSRKRIVSIIFSIII
jgi:hypothetical protein